MRQGVRSSPAEVSPADVSPADVSPVDVSPVDVSPADVSPADVSRLESEVTTAAFFGHFDHGGGCRGEEH